MSKVDTTTDLARLPSVTGNRNAFKYKKRVFTTYNVGEITPIYHNMLIQPGDTIIMNMASLIRTPAQLFPCYDSLICEVFAFWRSHNDMYIHFNEVMGENKTGIWIAQQEYSLPQVVIPSGTKLDAHDILAHLGFPIQAGGYSGSKIGLDLYHYICNEYFNNNTVMPPVMWSDGDNNITYDGSSLTGGTLRKACKLPDYFNTGVPEPLRAQEVNIPLTAQPVVGTGMTLGFTDGNNNYGIKGRVGSSVNFLSENLYGTNVGTNYSSGADDIDKTIGITTDPEKSGLITDIQGSAIALNSLLAERMLSNDVNNPKAPIALNPEDFELWTAGSYCLETGEIKSNVKYLARALDYVKKNQTQPAEM